MVSQMSFFFSLMRPARAAILLLFAGSLCVLPHRSDAQTAGQSAPQQTPAVPDWAQPGTATHEQVPPPADFHRATTNFDKPIGVFEGQSDIGSAVVPGSASYDPTSKQYTITS